MKDIRLLRLELENFKCHRHLLLEPEGRSMQIFGDNGAGKTSVYDSLLWLLFGKDSAGNTERLTEVKPLDGSGQIRDPLAITSVEALLSVDAQDVRLRKTISGQYRDQEFLGNQYSYFVNGVPQRKAGYDRKIRELIPEEVFRMLTSVGYFADEMKWQERRALLFEMAGSPEDRALMELDGRFAPLASALEGRTVADHRTMLLQRKKEQSALNDQIPARINECARMLAQLPQEEPEELREQIRELEQHQEDSGETRRAAEQQALQQRQEELQREKTRTSAALAGADREASALEREALRLRQEWIARKDQGFEGDRCPACGQTLPFDQLQIAAEKFEKERKTALDSLNARLQNVESRRSELAVHRANLARALEELEGELSKIGEKLSKNVENCRKVFLDTPQRSLAELRRALAGAEQRARTEQRIGQLRQEKQEAERALAQIGEQLGLIEEFVHFKAGFAEDSVNSMFKLARFKLFRQCANGTLEERCDAVFEGVPYLNLNRGARVNIGIDIINRLSQFYGVRVPLFVDNAEGITRLEPPVGQLLRLIVSGIDPVLRAETEW